MSLALEKLTPITVNDPRTIQEPRVYPVLKGGQEVLYKKFTTTSVSSGSINFSCPPPSSHVYVDRRIHLQLPVRLTITASGLTPGQRILNPHQCCIRSYPAQKALGTVQMTINNQSMSINISDTLSALEHFNIDRKLKAADYSKCPTYGACQSQQFSDLYGATRSPMSLYGDGLDDLAPAAFPYTIVQQTPADGSGNASSIVDFVTTEPLFLSPLYWGPFDSDASAFWGLRTFDMTLNFINGNSGNRMLAIDKDSSGVAFPPGAVVNAAASFSNFTTHPFSYEDNVPQLLFQYLTPQMTDKAVSMDKVLNYPYFNVERFPLDLPPAPPGIQQTASSNNIQLNSIPSKMYIFLRRNNQDMDSSPFHADTFLKIDSLSLQWGNRNGVLASASQAQLYDLAVKNGFQGSWSAWSGLKLNKPALASAGFGSPAEQYAGLGSIVALDTLDLGLSDLDAPGKLAQLMLQVQVNYRNVSDETFVPSLYVVIVSQGLFTIYNGQASSLIGVLTSEDILTAHKQTGHAMISYADVRRVNGGNFLSDIKDKLMSIWKHIKPFAETALGVARTVAQVAPLLGLGEDETSGGVRAGVRAGVTAGVRAGGAKVPRKKLKKRLK